MQFRGDKQGILSVFKCVTSYYDPIVVINVSRANESARPACGKLATKVHSSELLFPGH